MFENIVNFFKGLGKNKSDNKSKGVAKERLHLVLMQDRANISADFLALMKQEIIEVIKKYIDVDENAIDVRLTNKSNDDGTTGAPVLYANIPILNVKEEAKEEARKVEKSNSEQAKKEDKTKKVEKKEISTEKQDKETKKELKEKEDKTEKKLNDEKKEVAGEENESDNKESTETVIEAAEEIVEELKEEEKETTK